MSALAIDPRFSSISPAGVQMGKEVELTLQWQPPRRRGGTAFLQERLHGGEAGGDRHFVCAKVKVAADCPLGEHPRARAHQGRHHGAADVLCGAVPVVSRADPAAGEPHQKLPLNSTVANSVPNESQEIYTVDAKKGQRLSAEIESMRLGRGFYDPYIEILDTKGFILSRSDDTKLFIQDCYASAVVPEDGYTIKVRETNYGTIALYQMHVGTFARPSGVPQRRQGR